MKSSAPLLERPAPQGADTPRTDAPRRAAPACTHVITDLDVGGSEIMLANLVRHMPPGQARHRVVSLTTTGRVGAQLREQGIEVEALGLRRGALSNVGAVARLARLLKRQRPAIVQTWLYHADLVGLLAARLARVPHVVWNIRCCSTSFPGRPMTKMLQRLNARLSGWPQAIVVNSEAGRALHAGVGYRPDRMRVIPNGFDAGRFRPRPELRAAQRRALELPQDAFVIALVGNWGPFKGHATFFEAAEAYAADDASAWFVLAGAGLEPGQPGVEALIGPRARWRVKLLGLRGDIDEVLQACDVACSSSVSEGFPNVVGEAMASGVPCVVTDVGDSARLVGETGTVIPAGDPQAMAAAWRALAARSVQERQALGLAARERIVSRFSLEAVAAQYGQLYRELAREPR